jgi:hypothetical protein
MPGSNAAGKFPLLVGNIKNRYSRGGADLNVDFD